ncbi:MAG TPA: hypothetical protein VKS79_09945 [Gemmataceae bacterium]|nr:hypothetical protein [Gemmataceae bacterium]
MKYGSVCWFTMLVLALGAGGCNRSGASGEKKSVVKGRITNAGNVIPVKPMVGIFKVRFYRMQEGADDKTADPFDAVVDTQTGNFEVKGADGKGIPGGKYRIAIQQFDTFPPSPEQADTVDAFKGKFAPGKSPIIRDVDGSNEINIDVSKPQG